MAGSRPARCRLCLARPIARGERPMAHLDGFVGILQVDGYVGYRALAAGNSVSWHSAGVMCVGASMN